jgi:MYXO-CTERM domain-containing protein
MLIVPATAPAAILLSENFESLPLGPYVSPTETGGDGTDWTDVAPPGWIRDQTTTPAGSPIEFYGWTFHDRQSWISTEGDQSRSAWIDGAGTVMVADPDAYDDGTEVDEMLYNVNIRTPVIPLAGIVPGSVIIEFASSFRAEAPEIATLDVTFDGVTYTNLLTYDGNTLPDGALFNDPVIIGVNNPGSGDMQFRFSMNNASNDWWWAVDNVLVSGDQVPEPSAAALALLALLPATRRRR